LRRKGDGGLRFVNPPYACALANPKLKAVRLATAIDRFGEELFADTW
jgi:hypothetical protein